MGNSNSHPNSRRDSPAPLPSIPSRSRPLKHKKRSIVDHPQLLAAQSPAIPPSTPIPIPNQAGYTPQERPTPPSNSDSFSADTVPDLLSHNQPREENHHTHRPIQYNSTRSFGGVRRGGIQGGGWANDPPSPNSQPPPAFVEEIVRSSIPLRIHQAALPDDALSYNPEEEEDEGDENEGHIPTRVTWRAGGKEVLLAGTFDQQEWCTRERMRFDPQANTHSVTLYLSPGTYRIKFIVDDVWRCSDDMPTATDDETGNLVNYIDVEDPNALDLNNATPGADERQSRDIGIMKANRRRIYPPKTTRAATNSRSPTNTRAAFHPPLLPPSESSFWGDNGAEKEQYEEGWERGRDGVLERWTNIIPEPLIAAAHQEEAYLTAVQAQREVRRGGAGTRGALGSLGMGVPTFPPAPRLPRHLDKVILNTKSSSSHSGGGSSRSSRSGKHKSRSGLGMTSLLVPEGTVSSGVSLKLEKSASAAAMEQWAQADDSSVLPVPSHVVLHHLGTSAIKNSVLAVSDSVRYNKKYITTIYYKST